MLFIVAMEMSHVMKYAASKKLQSLIGSGY